MVPAGGEVAQCVAQPAWLSGGGDIHSAMLRLRARRSALYHGNSSEIQRQAVRALSLIAESFRNQPNPTVLRSASNNWELAELSLAAMLETWSEDELWRLTDSEGVQAPACGPALVLHIVAANTPLLAWTSVARALLVGASSLVRLPADSNEILYWTGRFREALASASPRLAELVTFAHWNSDDFAATITATESCDSIVAYGSDLTITELRALTPPAKVFVGYGHRFSLGIVDQDADYASAAEGTALDIRIFDQQGCLSPQIVFVVGEDDAAERFGGVLADKLASASMGAPERTADEIAKIREIVMLARFEPQAMVRHDPGFRWTIVVSPAGGATSFGCRGVVTVTPISTIGSVRDWLERQNLMGRLQGVSWAGDAACKMEAYHTLEKLGASYVCAPGWLQRPPFTWREDNLPLLRSLTTSA